MWENDLLGVHLDNYGFTIDSAWFYLSISYNLLLIAGAFILARRFYLKRKRVR